MTDFRVLDVRAGGYYIIGYPCQSYELKGGGGFMMERDVETMMRLKRINLGYLLFSYGTVSN